MRRTLTIILILFAVTCEGQWFYSFFGLKGGGKANNANAESLVFPKGAGVETQESKTVLLYSLDTFVANGCKIKITSDTGNLEIYDIRLLVKLDSRP